VALALSGGGDSVALLTLAADWARSQGRRVLALTVDHGLSPDSAAWTGFAERAAHAAGVEWRGLRWGDPKPATGLPAAARRARHRLIAGAARAAGARVILFAHTADDIAEAELMRAEGASLGRLRTWAPSPAWPEGRGLMLLRPMLDARRTEIRHWLVGQGADWIEDPANDDPRYGRSRARQRLSAAGVDDEGIAPPPAGPSAADDARASRAKMSATPDGSVRFDRGIDGPALAAVLVCVGGGDRPPRGDRLGGLQRRLRSGEVFAATLCGARIEARDDGVLATREAGEFLRRPGPSLPLEPGVETVWDGRWAVTAPSPGWSVVPAAGRMAALSDPDRTTLRALPLAARGAQPVLIRNDSTAPVLAGRTATAAALVGQRLALALDRMTHERDLGGVIHGASPRNHLFSGSDITDERAPRRIQGPRRE
jgi:tRNA(Ile)-lysidine synthase